MPNVAINQYSHLPEKVSVYHSELVHACAQHKGAGMWVQLKTNVRTSQYKNQDGTPRTYVAFMADGDSLERKYQPENDAIAIMIAACPLNVPLFVRAAGGRDSALLEVWNEQKQRIGAGNTPAPVVPAPAQRTAPAAAPAQSTNGNGAGHHFPKPEDRLSLGDEMYEALVTARAICERFQESTNQGLSEDTLWSMTASLFIERNKSDGRRSLRLTGQPDADDAQLEAAARNMGPQTGQSNARQPVGAAAGSSPFDSRDIDLPF